MGQREGVRDDDAALLALVAAVLAPARPAPADVVMAGRAAWRALPTVPAGGARAPGTSTAGTGRG